MIAPVKYSCLLVDDEPIALEVLTKYIQDTDALEIKGATSNAIDAGLFLETHEVDVLFLDIQMPGLTGLDFLRRLPKKPLTILTTAYRNHALEGFELGVMDYLVKPIKLERFMLAVARAIEFLDLRRNDLRELVNQSPVPDKNIVIKSGTRKISLSLDDISHIQGLKDYCIIFAGKNKYLVKGYIKTIESQFHPNHFIRVHKSFIVARNRINVVNKSKIEIADFQIPVGKSYKERVENLLRQSIR